MDLFLSKKSDHPLSNWSRRCFQFQNCQLIQYRKEIDEFNQCTDESVKHTYNICEIQRMLLNPKVPYVLKVRLPTKYEPDANNILLKFNDDDENNGNHALFVAVYRIMAASSKTTTDCAERPLPSNICVAIYYLLQKLYQHQDTLATKFIFKESIIKLKHIQNIYCDLIGNSDRFVPKSANDASHLDTYNELDPCALSMTLLYTLEHMPSSLFCDCHCKSLTDFVAKTMNGDLDITHLANNNRIEAIKNYLIQIYSERKLQFIKTHSFHLFNRYGFMAILFNLLHDIQSTKYTQYTSMSALDLAEIFAICLQSKRYLFISGGDPLYEKAFIVMVQVMIYYARTLFPDLKLVDWDIKSLIRCQGREKKLIRYYNNQYSKNTKNEYYIAPIMDKHTNYGNFDSAVREPNLRKVSSATHSTSKTDKNVVPKQEKKENKKQKEKEKYIEKKYIEKKETKDEEEEEEHEDEEEDNYHDDTQNGFDDEPDQNIETEMKYPDLVNVKETVKTAVGRLIPSDLEWTPDESNIEYDGHSISEQRLSQSSDDEEPQLQPQKVAGYHAKNPRKNSKNANNAAQAQAHRMSDDIAHDSNKNANKAPNVVNVQINTQNVHSAAYDPYHYNQMVDDQLYDEYDDEDEYAPPYFDQCESCMIAPLLRFFGYNDRNQY